MKTNYVLVDYENVKVDHLARLSDDRFRVTLFLGVHDTKLPVHLVLAMQLKASESTQTNANRNLDELVRIATADLVKRKTSRPASEKTLRSTIHATCGKQLHANQIDKVLAELGRRGWVKLAGTSVIYNLPQ